MNRTQLAAGAGGRSAPAKIRFKQALVVLAGLLVAAGMVLMGLWQLRVYQNQGAEAAARRAAEPAVPLSAVAPAGAAARDGYGRSGDLRRDVRP